MALNSTKITFMALSWKVLGPLDNKNLPVYSAVYWFFDAANCSFQSFGSENIINILLYILFMYFCLCEDLRYCVSAQNL